MQTLQVLNSPRLAQLTLPEDLSCLHRLELGATALPLELGVAVGKASQLHTLALCGSLVSSSVEAFLGEPIMIRWSLTDNWYSRTFYLLDACHTPQ